MAVLRIKCSKKPLLTMVRSKQWTKKMVYILLANKAYKYKNGRSRIVYIGTTAQGAGRPAASAVNKAAEAFGTLRGVKRLEAHIVTCSRRKALQSWLYLESALLHTFRKEYFELPKYNKQKGRPSELFKRSALEKLILQFE